MTSQPSEGSDGCSSSSRHVSTPPAPSRRTQSAFASRAATTTAVASPRRTRSPFTAHVVGAAAAFATAGAAAARFAGALRWLWSPSLRLRRCRRSRPRVLSPSLPRSLLSPLWLPLWRCRCRRRSSLLPSLPRFRSTRRSSPCRSLRQRVGSWWSLATPVRRRCAKRTFGTVVRDQEPVQPRNASPAAASALSKRSTAAS